MMPGPLFCRHGYTISRFFADLLGIVTKKSGSSSKGAFLGLIRFANSQVKNLCVFVSPFRSRINRSFSHLFPFSLRFSPV